MDWIELDWIELDWIELDWISTCVLINRRAVHSPTYRRRSFQNGFHFLHIMNPELRNSRPLFHRETWKLSNLEEKKNLTMWWQIQNPAFDIFFDKVEMSEWQKTWRIGFNKLWRGNGRVWYFLHCAESDTSLQIAFSRQTIQRKIDLNWKVIFGCHETEGL